MGPDVRGARRPSRPHSRQTPAREVWRELASMEQCYYGDARHAVGLFLEPSVYGGGWYCGGRAASEKGADGGGGGDGSDDGNGGNEGFLGPLVMRGVGCRMALGPEGNSEVACAGGCGEGRGCPRRAC